MSNNENIVQDTKHELEDKAQKENNEVDVLEITIMDPKGPIEYNNVLSHILRSKNEVKWYMVLLGLRIAAFMFCLISFSVLGSNEQNVLVKETLTNWFSSGFDVQTPYRFFWYNYDEFKYSFLVNVIGFVYSGLQICLLVRYLITKKHTINPKVQGYFNVVIDQILAYILMSASSSAATAANLFESYLIEHGALKFKAMTIASVVMSFFAFLVFALASLVSAFILSRF